MGIRRYLFISFSPAIFFKTQQLNMKTKIEFFSKSLQISLLNARQFNLNTRLKQQVNQFPENQSTYMIKTIFVLITWTKIAIHQNFFICIQK